MNYEFTGETKEINGITLHRIRATKDNPRLGVMSGDVGGWIEQESNLSGNAWVAEDACVYGEARVSGEACVHGRAQVFGEARVYCEAQVSGAARVFCEAQVSGRACVFGEALVYGKARVFGDACVYGGARVFGDARVSGDATVTSEAWVCGDATIKSDSDYSVFKNTWSSGRWFTYTKSNRMWSVGCFYGTGDELIKKAYADSVESGKCYEAIVRAQEAIEKAVN